MLYAICKRYRIPLYLECDDMETFSTSLVFCQGNPPDTGGFPSQRSSNAQMLSLILPSTNCKRKSRTAGDLGHHDARAMSL